MVNLETTLWYSSIALKGLSFSPLPPKATRLQKALNLAHFSFVWVIVFFMCLQISTNIIQNSTGSHFIIEQISTQLGFARFVGKLIIYRLNRRKFFKLLKNMNNMVENGSSELKSYLQRCGRMSHFIYLTYMSLALLLFMDYCLMPLFEDAKDLPIPAWYPFDYHESTLYYSLAYSHQISVFIITWLGVGVTVMFGVLILGCCAQCKVLQEMLKRLNRPDSDPLRTKPGTEACLESIIKFDKKIAELVDLHCEVLDSIKDINDIHTWILFVFILVSVMMVCCAGFQITDGVEQSFKSQIRFYVMSCCVLLELSFFFVPGDMLVEEATAIGTAAYHSDWESMLSKHQKSVLLIILRSAKPPKLTAARVMPLVLENYASLLASTASYFTSLQAVTRDD